MKDINLMKVALAKELLPHRLSEPSLEVAICHSYLRNLYDSCTGVFDAR
jgi:hypothetical protein